MTGDVLPCFDAFSMVLPEDAASIVTVPITLDIASNHGVIVATKIGLPDDKCSVFLVENLLQKPNIEDLVHHQAILDDGRTLLDTGIIAVKGKAWVDLVMLACSSQPMISELLQSKKEASELVLGCLSSVLLYLIAPCLPHGSTKFSSLNVLETPALELLGNFPISSTLCR